MNTELNRRIPSTYSTKSDSCEFDFLNLTECDNQHAVWNPAFSETHKWYFHNFLPPMSISVVMRDNLTYLKASMFDIIEPCLVVEGRWDD